MQQGKLINIGRLLVFWDNMFKLRPLFVRTGSNSWEIALPGVIIAWMPKLYSSSVPEGS